MSDEKLPKVHCPKCGQILDRKEKFCTNCGNQIPAYQDEINTTPKTSGTSSSNQEWIEGLRRKFAEADSENQKEIISQVLETVKSLPQDHQNIVLKQINANEISEETIRKAIVAGPFGPALAYFVNDVFKESEPAGAFTGLGGIVFSGLIFWLSYWSWGHDTLIWKIIAAVSGIIGFGIFIGSIIILLEAAGIWKPDENKGEAK